LQKQAEHSSADELEHIKHRLVLAGRLFGTAIAVILVLMAGILIELLLLLHRTG
jgi:hypothetical protein